MSKAKADAIAVEASLANGLCLKFDNEGAARLTLELAQPEAAKLAEKLPQLMDTTFWVTFMRKA